MELCGFNRVAQICTAPATLNHAAPHALLSVAVAVVFLQTEAGTQLSEQLCVTSLLVRTQCEPPPALMQSLLWKPPLLR